MRRRRTLTFDSAHEREGKRGSALTKARASREALRDARIRRVESTRKADVYCAMEECGVRKERGVKGER